MCLTNANSTVCHSPEEYLSLQIGHHEHLQMLCLYLTDRLVGAEYILTLDLDDEFLKALYSARKVSLCAILVIVVANNSCFKHMKDFLNSHCFPINNF